MNTILNKERKLQKSILKASFQLESCYVFSHSANLQILAKKKLTKNQASQKMYYLGLLSKRRSNSISIQIRYAINFHTTGTKQKQCTVCGKRKLFYTVWNIFTKKGCKFS